MDDINQKTFITLQNSNYTETGQGREWSLYRKLYKTPKLYKHPLYLLDLKNFGDFNQIIRLAEILIYRGMLLFNTTGGSTLIYRPLSYPFRPLQTVRAHSQ